MKKNFIFTSIAVAVLSMSVTANAATRDLVFEDDEEDTQAENVISVKTTVELNRGGEKSTVTPDTTFKSGDKVKLVFTPNIDGYVYWMAKGSSGEYTVLYPSKQAGMDNAVKRNETYTVPPKGAFKFDDNVGEENLLCILAPNRLADLDEAIGVDVAATTDVVNQLETEKASKKKAATRDLVFEDEDDEETGVNTTSQSSENGEPFVAPYTLKHE